MDVRFMYTDDNVDEGLLVVFINNSQEGILLDAKVAELLGQVLSLVRVVERAGVVVHGEFLFAVA